MKKLLFFVFYFHYVGMTIDAQISFTSNTISRAAMRATSVYAADVDGDGDLDVLSASFIDDKIAWYENDGSQSFTAHTISRAAIRATSVYAADVDGDGDLDVLSASTFDYKIAWYENKPLNNIMGRDTNICAGQSINLRTLVNGTPLNTLEYGNVFGTYGLTNAQSPTAAATTFFVRDSNTTTMCVDTAKIVVSVTPQPLITGRDTAVMLGQIVDLTNLINGSITGSLDFGATFGTYGLPNPITALPTTYFIRDSVQNAVGCVDTAKVTISIPNVVTSIVDKDGDGNPDIDDPCNCFDPKNVVIQKGANRQVTLFHDFVTITNSGINQIWVLDGVNSGSILLQNGNPIPLNTPLKDLGGSTYRLDFWHQPNNGFNATFRRLSDNHTETISSSCDEQDCIIVPTMSKWSLVIFSLLIMNLSVFFVQRRELI